MAVDRQGITIAQFEQFINRPDNIDRHFELLEEGIVEVTSTNRHSALTVTIATLLKMHLIQNGLGGVVTGETGGYLIDGKCPNPDVAYVNAAKQAEPSDVVCNPISPDLVVEVISNEDSLQEMERTREKRALYLSVGATVWEVHQHDQSVDVYTPDGRYERVHDVLTFSDLPGFLLPVADIFNS